MNPEQQRPHLGGQPNTIIRPPQGLPLRPLNAGAPIRPNMQGVQPRPLTQGVPIRPMIPPGVRPPGVRPMTPPMMRPMASVPRPLSPSNVPRGISPQPDLTSSMQNMHIQPPVHTAPHSTKTRRVYATAPGIAHPQQQQAPWPHSLPQQTPLSPTTKQLPVQPNIPAVHQAGYAQQKPLPDHRPGENRSSRIDPDQMPAPVQLREQDEVMYGNKYLSTIEKERMPLSTTQYIALDQGNCNPRFMRSTLNHIPHTKEMKDASKLPMGIVIAPLAKQRPDEEPIQTVDHGEEGPIRCSRCRAYINPWCTFTHGGSRFECNICNHSNEVPTWYFGNIDMSGRRIDLNERPELQYGSVEFSVPADYYSERKPAPLRYVFALDVSIQSIQTGMLQSVCEALKHTLYGGDALHNEIAIMTYDKCVHFYNLSPLLSSAQMLVVSDIDDMFLPLQDGFFVQPEASKNVICNLLDALPHMMKDTVRPESVYTAAVRGALQALKSSGGHVFVFQTCLPNYGVDALKPRDDKNVYGTDKEKNLLVHQSEKYKDLAKECVKSGVCVNTWTFPTQYMDLATINVISQLTGGDLRYYPGFQHYRDKQRIVFQLNHDIRRHTGYDGVMRIRCSNGLQVVAHYGNIHESTYTDVDLAGIDEDKSITAVFKHDGKLTAKQGASFQCALLYTTREGYRRVRVHNMQLPVSSEISDVFRYGDTDATVNVIMKQTIYDLYHKHRKDLHKKLTDMCVDILTAYRINCASSTSPGQLILPEAFKLLPVYIHGALRTSVLRGVGNDINMDARIAGMSMFNSMTVAETVWTLYPRMYPIHTMAEGYGLIEENDVKLPPMVRTSYERLENSGAYVVDTGSDLFLWLGNKISSEFLKALLGVESLEEVDTNMIVLPTLPTDLSTRVHTIMHKLQSQRSKYLAFHIVRQEKDAIEFLFATWMCEDRNAEVQNYVDYMCVLHRRIQDEMKKLDN